MPVYLVRDNNWNRSGPLMEGDNWRTRETTLSVEASTPNSPLIYVNADDPAVLQKLLERGEIASFEPERSDFTHRAERAPKRGGIGIGGSAIAPLSQAPGAPDPWVNPPNDLVLARSFSPRDMGDTYALLLESVERIREAVDYGDGCAILDYDTGCKSDHEVFAECNFSIPQPGFDDIDSHGHGTFTAGQMHKLLPRAVMVPIKLLDGPNGSGTSSGIVKHLHRGLEYWRAMGTPIAAANNSWGSDGGDAGIDSAFRYCHQNGLFMTNAQGNSNGSVSQPGSPTRVARFVAAAMDRAFNNAPFTSGGDGWAITTAWYCGVDEWGPDIGGGYRLMSGTSMADPWLTCCVVILRKLHPDWVEEQLLSYILTHAQAMARVTRNGKGHGVLGIDLLPAQDEPAPVEVPGIAEQRLQDIYDTDTEIRAIVGRTQEKRALLGSYLVADPTAKSVLQETFREIGALEDYTTQVDGHAQEMYAALKSSANGNPPKPTPAPTTLPPGSYTLKYGEGARQYVQVVIPPNALTMVDLILAGGAWQVGGDPAAVPLGDGNPGVLAFAPLEVQQWYLNNRHILVMGAYPLNDIAYATESARLMLKWIAANCEQWGGNPEQITVAGHSAGAHAVAAAACDPGAPPVKAVICLSGACFYIDASWANTNLGRIIARPWGNPSNWQQWSIHTLLDAAPRKLRIMAVHGRYDDQVPLTMMQRFIAYAAQKGHSSELAVINGGHGEPGSPSLPETKAAFLKAWS